LPLAFGLTWFALLFGVLNIAMLFWRIRIEDAALRASDGQLTVQKLL
jgi:methyltransferase